MAIRGKSVNLLQIFANQLLKHKQCSKASSALVSKLDSRRFSTSQPKRRIITSILDPITVPKQTLPEYMEHHMKQWGDRVAVECFDSGKQYTYNQILENVKYLAANLRTKVGVEDNDTICVVLPNVAEYPIVCLGIIAANGICSTCNPSYTADEISKQLINSTSKFVLTVDVCYDKVKKAVDTLPKPIPIIIIKTKASKLPTTVFDFDDLINPNTPLDVLNKLNKLPLDRTIFRPYSSGTTGLPKGVDLTHQNITANLEQSIALGPEVNKIDYLDDNTPAIVPAVLPFFHIFGLTVTQFGKLITGAKLIAMPTFNIPNFVTLFKKYKPHKLFCVPPLVLLMIANGDITKEDLGEMGIICNGAAPLSVTDVERLKSKTRSDVKFIQGYGLTETSPMITCYNTAIKSVYNPGSVGSIVSNTEGRFIDPRTGEDADPEEGGELWIRGPQVMKGYYNNEAATRDVLTEDGWFKTGDILRMDKNNLFYITDRLKELIKVKGFQVAPAELEAIIRTHPDILDSAVVGVPHPFYGEAPKAFVTTKGGKKLSEKEIQDFVAKQVAEYKQLSGGVVFLDQIPKSAAGKILRRQLLNQ